MAKTTWVGMQPAFAAAMRREAGLGLGRQGRRGCGLSEGWAGLGWAGLAACTVGGGTNGRTEEPTWLE